MMINRCLPGIVMKIDEKLDKSVVELSKLPAVITCEREAWMTLTDIIRSVESLLKLLIIQGEYSEYPDDLNMHCSARLADMLIKFSNDLQAQPQVAGTEFLMDEINVLEECKCIGLPNFLRMSAFVSILSQRLDAIRARPVEFMKEIWDYLEAVLSSVINKYSENFSQIQPSIQRASRRLISKIKEQSVTRVVEMVEMEKMMEYTCNPEYTTVRTQMIAAQANFVNTVVGLNLATSASSGFGTVPITHLRKYPAQLLHQALDLKISITAYWAIVVRRIVDSVALHLQFTVKNLVNSQFQKEIVGELGGGDFEKMLDESPSVACKRERLKNSIKLLKESKEAVAAVLDQSPGHGYRY
ncbi:Dynamin-related protein 4C [Raphanus sativus]|nr:Dynamin-related protein 4C [Raphanus sativus]